MAILGELPLTLKVGGDILKLWWVNLHKWLRFGGQKRQRWVSAWFDRALPSERGRVMCDVWLDRTDLAMQGHFLMLPQCCDFLLFNPNRPTKKALPG
jgi:hypothetical protein